MNVTLFLDYVWNGDSFANKEYNSTEAIGKELTASEIARIRNIWKEIEFCLIATCVVSLGVGSVVAVSAFMTYPLFAVALAIGVIALSMLTVVRIIDVRIERNSWDRIEPDQNFQTRANAMIRGHEEDIQKSKEYRQTLSQFKEALDSYR